MWHMVQETLEERGGADLKVHCKDHWEWTEVKVTVGLVTSHAFCKARAPEKVSAC